MAMRLEKGLGSTADMWLRMQDAYNLAQIRNRNEDLRVESDRPQGRSGVVTPSPRRDTHSSAP